MPNPYPGAGGSRASQNLAAMRDDIESDWPGRLLKVMASTQEVTDLSDRETMALRAASYGMSASDTAALLGSTQCAITSRWKNAQRKLRAKNTCHAVALAIRGGLL